MIRAFLLLAALAACEAGGGDPVGAGSGPGPVAAEETADCSLSISFASYAMGIDGGTFRAVEALLGQDRAVSSVEHRGWGREGEVTLCARTASDADAERLHRRIAALLPADPRGPIQVATRTGLNAHAPRR